MKDIERPLSPIGTTPTTSHSQLTKNKTSSLRNNNNNAGANRNNNGKPSRTTIRSRGAAKTIPSASSLSSTSSSLLLTNAREDQITTTHSQRRKRNTNSGNNHSDPNPLSQTLSSSIKSVAFCYPNNGVYSDDKLSPWINGNENINGYSEDADDSSDCSSIVESIRLTEFHGNNTGYHSINGNASSGGLSIIHNHIPDDVNGHSFEYRDSNRNCDVSPNIPARRGRSRNSNRVPSISINGHDHNLKCNVKDPNASNGGYKSNYKLGGILKTANSHTLLNSTNHSLGAEDEESDTESQRKNGRSRNAASRSDSRLTDPTGYDHFSRRYVSFTDNDKDLDASGPPTTPFTNTLQQQISKTNGFFTGHGTDVHSKYYGADKNKTNYDSDIECLQTNSDCSILSSSVTVTTMSNDDVSSAAVDLDVEQSTIGSRAPSSRRTAGRVLGPDHVSHQFFYVEPCVYSHRMFQRAARIFSVLKHDEADTEEKKAFRRRNGEISTEKPKIPDMDFLDSHEQIKTFELTFATLKFQKLFSHILDYIGFFHKYSNLNDHYSLVFVILHDLQTRKFQRRIPFGDECLDKDCFAVEESLLAEKTKLQANIAKERIKHNAPSVDYLLPEHVRNKDETKARTPVYMWVNQMKTTVENVIANLKSDNFRLLEAGTDMSDVTEPAFVIDPHCSDVLTFPPHMNMELKQSDMVKTGLLVQQDKSSCLAPQTVSHILGNDNDAIHVNIGTGMSTCHLASLMRRKASNGHIWAFGVQEPQKIAKVLKTIETLEVKSIKVMNDDFLNTDPEDSKYKSVRVILISANCSKSAITSPVQFIVSEGEDTQILGELSVGEADMNHVRDLMVDHERLLRHALKFPKVQAVVYTTRSRFELENELVVERVLEFVNANGNKHAFKVSPPVIEFSSEEIDTGQSGIHGRYVRFLPSDKANGCFVAVIAREPEEMNHRKLSLDPKKSKKLGKSKSAQSTTAGFDKPKKHLRTESFLSEINTRNDNGNAYDAAADSSIKSRSSSSTSVGKKQQKNGGVGNRLYQEGISKKIDKSKSSTSVRPEHMKVVKHPAPFR